MAEKVEQAQQASLNGQQNNNVRKSPEFPGVISRERSFVRTSNQQNINKRRSLAFNVPGNNQTGQMRSKPAMDIYRPPKLNYSLQHSSSSSLIFPPSTNGPGGVAVAPVLGQYGNVNRRQAGLSLGSMPGLKASHHRSILVTHPISPLAGQLPLMNSPSSGNILHTTNRVKFAPEPRGQKLNNHSQFGGMNNNNYGQPYQANLNGLDPYMNGNALQRSKSLSSADALTRGMAGLGLGLGNEVADIGQFTPEIQTLIETALEDPNKLNSRCLMELTTQFIKRAVESRRFALPISRLCLNIIAREQKETFLEALLNTCRQWYQEREKLLFAIQGMKSPSRVRFTAFMAFLTEMFCQLKRRQLQLRTHHEGTPPPLVLLSLLSKCCEDCVRPPIRSLSEIECLFYVLTCIGQDMEQQLPQQLELLMGLVRDAFLNAGESAASIRRTLLQLIELKASHWQLPGNTVLYYTHNNN
ncbi:uncharacterized protein Dana_GF14154, isoform C [Drosophila ananassae]|uniref:Uncharacterized protein, isoform C n=1 Tax=Drosophila ananassae TaxID=7217 RepID=A0A0P8ZGG3_DROAN|nr:uncharacterized protein LOC6496982 isoform X2 [Drosophila ananassae]KPU73855.1 uncharacterized protein Dana_GF14154, isoform C [Drosophila ananassae]